MDQKAFLAVTAMLNSFPQNAGNPDLTMTTFEAVLQGLSSAAVIEAAQRFTCGDVPGQNRTFAPSVAEFVQEARRIHEVLPLRARKALPTPERAFRPEPGPAERIRMGFKLTLLKKSFRNGGIDALAEANKRGLEDLIALGQTWEVPIPDELWRQLKAA